MNTTCPFRLPRKTPLGIAESIAEWATGLRTLSKFYKTRPQNTDTTSFLRFCMESLGIDYHISQGSIDGIPTKGATIIVANHPLGCIDGVILAELLGSTRGDLKILANNFLKKVPELNELFIAVDVLEGKNATQTNVKALRSAYQHLAQGGMLLVFPAGEVSSYSLRKRRLEDKEWNRSVGTLIRKTKATTIPIYIDGENSRSFYAAGKVHPLLRTMMLGREMLNKRGQCFDIAIGDTIDFKEASKLSDDQSLANYLYLNTYLLNSKSKTNLSTQITEQVIPAQKMIVPPMTKERLRAEIATLSHTDLLLQSADFTVYCSAAKNIPNILYEIGRIREESFRAVGEGTGEEIDLDIFDNYYYHLFIWDSVHVKIVGAYRLGLADIIQSRLGCEGLYSRSLFNYDERFLKQLGTSIELGRSVIATEYQRNLNSLLLLWKGIATYVSRNPQYTHLFGPVSISSEYSIDARYLMAETMTLHHYDIASSRLVAPSHPLKLRSSDFWKPSALATLTDIQLLSKVVARLDKEGKGIPVLLRQYLSLNGKLVCFNIDPSFNHCLDGLIVVDLRNVPEKTLGRYMGKDKAQHYFDYHRTRKIAA